MLQTFEATSRPSDGPPRLLALRTLLRAKGLSGFLVPRSDAHQGEWVPPRDERLAWLTGFSGSAGFCAALLEHAGVFIDGRYRIQVRQQTDGDSFTPVNWPETSLADWLKEALPEGGVIAFDPWLHVKNEIDTLTDALADSGILLEPSDNLIDCIWSDQPAAPKGKITPHPVEFAGISSADKRRDIAASLASRGLSSTVLTMPDSIAWLLNIRGSDIVRTPVALVFAILHDSGKLDLFADPAKINNDLVDHLGPDVTTFPREDFGPALDTLRGTISVDEKTAALWISERLRAARVDVTYAPDPCALPKACKNPIEIEGARQAHLRDGIAMADLLAWLDAQGPNPDLNEIDVVTKLEALRTATNKLVDISFETICGTGPNGAITHYRVTEQSNRAIQTGDLLLVDSGGQYRDGTTDITRTIAIGTPDDEQRRCFTRVLKGMIAISLARWPKGLAGRDIESLARNALWQAGLDFDHGTGHGVGSFLGVHEGPQRLSRLSEVPFRPGMILSNEPGYYREGAFGIRIENLLVVQKAPQLPKGDDREMLCFETLSFTPIDRNLIDVDLLSGEERRWIDDYHRASLEKIAPRCQPSTTQFLERACKPL